MVKEKHFGGFGSIFLISKIAPIKGIFNFLIRSRDELFYIKYYRAEIKRIESKLRPPIGLSPIKSKQT